MNPIITSTKPKIEQLPGGWEPKLMNVKILETIGELPIEIEHPIEGVTLFKKVFNPITCKKLIALMQRSPNFEAVSVQGNKDHLDNRIGSTRTTMWSPELAECIWEVLAPFIPKKEVDSYTLTDWWQNNPTKYEWEPVAVSPMLGFMKYETGGQHYAHYDAGFIYPDDNYRTLQSMVIYLTTNSTGATRFINDGQKGPVWNRNHNDWIRETEDNEVVYKSLPTEGNILLLTYRDWETDRKSVV